MTGAGDACGATDPGGDPILGPDPAVAVPAARRVRALVVDDEPSLVRAVVGYLEREGFQVDSAADGEQALRLARRDAPDIVVLDLGLPGIDGVEVCRVLRTFSDAYVVMLTARADEIDKLIGLSVGADDYLTKPFSLRELVARIRTMLRRPRTAVPEFVRRFGPLTIDPIAREVTLNDALIHLTRTEFDVLDALSEHPRQAFTRRQLIERVWDIDWVGDEHLVDIHIGHIRRKLDDDSADPHFILTVRGIGYRMGPG